MEKKEKKPKKNQFINMPVLNSNAAGIDVGGIEYMIDDRDAGLAVILETFEQAAVAVYMRRYYQDLRSEGGVSRVE